ncbi:NAD/NADP octopine/nopaline dehydrogenase family protein [Candidatus Woesearchaeota archaeon]|nr:NAD/NADP octopine/nopaline dehydrogenase family protein [Candidatus Woesearchaeota archaeon]
MTKNKPKYAVIGAGCGGQGIAGYLAYCGHDVVLYNRTLSKIKEVKSKGNIKLEGKLEGEGKLSYIGNDIERALQDRDVIMVVITATGHKEIAQKMAPYLKDGQIILLNPGRTCGALEVDYTLRQNGCKANVIVAETNTLIYAVRATSPGIATIKGVKKEVSTSALKSEDTRYVVDAIALAYPQFVPATSFLETSFGNIGAIFHPTITLLNKERIIAKENFDFYTDGVTKKVAVFIEQVDDEVRNVAKALETKVLSVGEWLTSRYGIELMDIYTMIKSNPTYKGIKAPLTLDTRYLWEDIPTGLVPISTFGDALGVATPSINYLIDEGCNVLNKDFWNEGRTPEKLALSRENLKENLENIIQTRELLLV